MLYLCLLVSIGMCQYLDPRFQVCQVLGRASHAVTEYIHSCVPEPFLNFRADHQRECRPSVCHSTHVSIGWTFPHPAWLVTLSLPWLFSGSLYYNWCLLKSLKGSVCSHCRLTTLPALHENTCFKWFSDILEEFVQSFNRSLFVSWQRTTLCHKTEING